MLDPTARDFDTLTHELKQRVQQRFSHLQTDPTDAGFTGMLIDLFAAVGDGLHFQLDNALQELFWDTVRDRQAASRLAALVGYRPKGAAAATVTLRFTRARSDESDKKAVTIPARTPAAGADGEIVFETLREATLPPNKPYIDVPAEHAQQQEQTAPGTDQPDQVIPAEYTPFVEGPVSLEVDGHPWRHVDDFLASGPDDPHYRVTVDAEHRLHVHLGNGPRGRIPTGMTRLRYRTGGGPEGNVLAGTLTTLEQALYDTSGQEVEMTVTNPRAASGGAPPETVQQIRRNALLRLRSQRRGVTTQDIIDHALAVPGVARVKLVTRLQDPRVPPHAGFLYVCASGGSPPEAPAAPEKLREETSKSPVEKKQGHAVAGGADKALVERVQRRFAHDVPLPVGFTLHVVPAPLVPVDLAWKAWLNDKTRADEVKQALRRALAAWLSPAGTQPWGRLPYPSSLVHVAHGAHPAIAGVELLTDLSRLAIKSHQLPVLGALSLAIMNYEP
ncbi:MAG: baseplate J/gp47 family protein [Myxococcota bacterium]